MALVVKELMVPKWKQRHVYCKHEGSHLQLVMDGRGKERCIARADRRETEGHLHQ